MIEMGIVVGIGLLVMLAKMNWRWKMRVLSNPVTIDWLVFIVLTYVHWGTFSGVMVAAVGALFCSIVLSIGRYCFGYIKAGAYYPGMWDVRSKL